MTNRGPCAKTANQRVHLLQEWVCRTRPAELSPWLRAAQLLRHSISCTPSLRSCGHSSSRISSDHPFTQLCKYFSYVMTYFDFAVVVTWIFLWLNAFFFKISLIHPTSLKYLVTSTYFALSKVLRTLSEQKKTQVSGSWTLGSAEQADMNQMIRQHLVSNSECCGLSVESRACI